MIIRKAEDEYEELKYHFSIKLIGKNENLTKVFNDLFNYFRCDISKNIALRYLTL